MTEILTACPTLPALSKVDLKDIDNADHSEVILFWRGTIIDDPAL